MMLKKQTIWLLTMLSLIIVLSVYYMTTPVQTPNELVTSGQKELEQSEGEKNHQTKEGKTDTSSISTASAFAAYELAREDARSRLMEQYTNIIASPTSSPQEKAEAQQKRKELMELASKERMLESLLIAKGYEAALVSTQGDEVTVIVKADHQSAAQANEIISLANKHLGEDKEVAVTFQIVE